MTERILFQAISPLVFAVYTACFLGVYLYDRRRVSAAWWAVTYAAAGIGLTLDITRDLLPWTVASVAVDACYAFTMFAFGVAVFRHHDARVPWILYALIGLTAAAVSSWFWIVMPDITARMLVIHGAVCALLGMCLPVLWRVRRDWALGRLVFWGVAIFVAQTAVRPLATLLLSSETLTQSNYTTHALAVGQQLGSVANAVVIAMALFFIFGLEAANEFRDQADHDVLTGLLNRRGMDRETRNAMARARRAGTPLSVIVADIDHFKQVNDTFGHAGGDEAIRAFGGTLKSLLRDTDLTARTGGEEFAVLLWNADEAGATRVADAMRLVFSNCAVAGLPDDRRLTASFGVAQINADDDVKRWFGRADRALYESKQNGRNRVTVARTRPVDLRVAA